MHSFQRFSIFGQIEMRVTIVIRFVHSAGDYRKIETKNIHSNSFVRAMQYVFSL